MPSRVGLLIDFKRIRKAVQKMIAYVKKTNVDINSMDLFYINGADVLPAPLTAEEEQNLLLQIQQHPEIIGTLKDDFKLENSESAINSTGKRRTKNRSC